MAEIQPFKYRAFLSYSHRDKAWGKWLHSALEGYKVDRDLVGRKTPAGPVPKMLRPIFRDRDDFSAGYSLTAQTIAALDASQFLIVICSPNAANSEYVNEEVRRFKILGRAERVVPVIVDGEPNHPTLECFPPALRRKLGADGQITDEREEPIAADARAQGDGKEIAKRKVVAGLLGLNLDEIVRRSERARRRRNRFWSALAGVFLCLTIAATGSAVYAYQKLIQSEERLDQAIEIAYGFVAEAASMSDHFGIPTDVTLNLLNRAEIALTKLISQGANSDALLFRKSLMLMSFSNNYSVLGKTDQALQRALEARSLLHSLAKTKLRESEWRLSLLRSELQVADLLTQARQLTAALKIYHDGLAAGEQYLRDEPTNVDMVAYLARLHINSGDILAVQGSFSEAAATYQNALNCITTFANGEAGTDLGLALSRQPRLSYTAIEASQRVARLQTAQGSHDNALNSHKWILTYRRGVLEAAPDSVCSRLGVLDALVVVASSQLDVGSIDEAMTSFREGLSTAEKLSASDPKNINYRRAVAILKDGVGRAFLAQSSTSDALETFRSNFETGKQFVEADSSNLVWQSFLGIGHERIGDALMLQRDFAGALQHYREEFSIVGRVLQSNPEDVELQSWIAISQFKIGEAILGLGQWPEAEPYFERSLAFWRQQTTSHQDIVVYQTYFFKTLWRISQNWGDVAALRSAMRWLEWLNDSRKLGAEERKWLLNSKEEFARSHSDEASVLALECGDNIPEHGIAGCTRIISTVGESTEKIATAHELRGDAYRVKEHFNEALSDYSEAIRLGHRYSTTYSNRGFCNAQLGKLDEAIVDLSQAIRLNPKNIARSNLGDVYLEKGEFDKAIEEYDLAIAIDPNNAGFYNGRGVALFRKNELEQAFGEFNNAIRLNPKNSIAYTNRGRVYELWGQFDQAIAEHNLALQMDTKLAIAFANRGLAYEGKGELPKALVDFESALAIDPKLPRAMEGRDRVKRALSRTTVAPDFSGPTLKVEANVRE